MFKGIPSIKSTFTALSVLALVASISGCAHQYEESPAWPSGGPPSSFSETDVEISLERTGCFGRCPSYTVTIYGDGRVVFDGRQFVSEIGRRESMIDVGQVVELLNHIYSIHFFDMKDEYQYGVNVRRNSSGEFSETLTVTSDLPSKIISVRIGDFRKQVIDYAYAPNELVELSPMIDEVAGTADWVGER